MANLCIPKSEMEKLKTAFRNGDVSIEKLYEMTDAERNILFSHYLGKDFAHLVNTEFERAMLSNQKAAFTKFVEKTFNPKQKDLRSAMIKRLEKIDKVMDQTEVDDFLGDLANTKLGMKNVSEAEIKTMLDMKKEFEDLRDQIPPDAPLRSKERLAYGLSLDNFQQYVGKLKERTTPLSAKEIALHKLTHPGEIIYDIGNVTKSALSTLDNSFFGRQAIKELFSPFTGGTKRWAKNFIRSWKDIGKQLVAKTEGKGIFSKPNDAVMQAIKADINSRPNALNGKYAAAKNKYGLNIESEEAFPSTIIERVPGIGRFFKAAEVAFNGGAQRMRADLADSLIARAEKLGVDVMDRGEASALGELVGQMTGRGEIGKAAVYGKQINALAFSIRFLKSNFDTLLAPLKLGKALLEGNKEGLFAKKQAALNLAQIVGSVAAIGTIANVLWPGSFEINPQSANFGKLKINGHYIDITGGMGAIATLAARIITGTSISSTGNKSELYSGKFGSKTGLDLVNDFFENKTSPMAGVVRDLLKGKNFQGEKPTIGNTVPKLITPISIQNFQQLQNPEFGDALLVIIADGLGFNTATPTPLKSKKKTYKFK